MISIVMPVYNAIDTLDEAFQSALRSGVADQEIVMVDDGSTDGSWDAIQRYQAAHPNVIALQHDRNRGGGAARNTGVQAARHDLIFVLDSDDVLGGPTGLRQPVKLMEDEGLDGLISGRSLFFKDHIANITSQSDHRLGPVAFQDLLSRNSLNFHGNFLFRKSAFYKAGGYPEHHGFDTQAFAFRLLGNNQNIIATRDLEYYRRLPDKPSYYIREARAGNINRNWFFIFFEYLYKFRPDVREMLLLYDYADPVALAKGKTIFDVLVGRAEREDIFWAEGLSYDDDTAYERCTDSSEASLQAWCASVDAHRNDVRKSIERLRALDAVPTTKRALYPLIAAWAGKGFDDNLIYEFRYFFGMNKPATWWARRTLQRVLNKISRLVPR